MSEFQNAFLNLMKSRGLTQADIVRATGFSRGSISMFANGKREPVLSTAVIIADAFECSLDDLVGRRVPGNLATVDISDLSKEQQAAVQTVVDGMRK